MNSVIPPINPGDQGEKVTNLQEVLQSFVDREIIRIPKDEWDQMSADLNGEKKKQYYGEVTANLVVRFRMQHDLGDGRDVDEPTAKAINALLEKPGRRMKVTGTVTGGDRKRYPDLVIKAYHQSLLPSELLGQTHPTSEGYYEISFTDLSTGQSKREITNLQVFVYDGNDPEITHSKIYYNAPFLIVVDLPLPDKRDKLSEYERMTDELEPLMQGLSLEKLPEEGIDLLAGNSSIPREQIVLLRQAFITASQYPDLPAPVLYGWFRKSLPTDARLLFTQPAEVLIESMQAAVKSRITPEQSPETIKKIREALSRISVEVLLAPAADAGSSLGDVLNTIPEKLPYDKQFIVARVLQDKSNPGLPLAEKLKSAGLEETQASAVERTLAFQSFSRNFLPLIRTLQEDPEIGSLKQLALKVSKENFTRKIIDKKAFPDNEDPVDFAGRLYNDLFLAEPTAILRNMLGDDKVTPIQDAPTRAGVASLLANLPESFNIKTTSVYEAFKNEKAFEGIEPGAQEKVKAEMRSLQRIAAISPAPEVVPVLMKANVTSALMVGNMPEKQFVRAFSGSLGKNGETIARQVHANAVNTRIRNEQALISFKEAKQGTGISMVDEAMRNSRVNDDDLKNTLEQNNLSWDLLFGDADLCECGECTSVYSAAAYFVDLLQYLRNNNLDPDAAGPLVIRVDPKDISNTPLEKLFGRRPDLKCLQLTCKNTNTILPYVDLVNEIMESYVVVHKTLPFNVDEDETSGELLAEPHHTNVTAYELLHEAVYPFSLPYHQPIDATRLFLDLLDTSRYELMNTFRSVRDTKFVLDPLSNDTAPKTPLSPLAVGLEPLYERFLSAAVDAEYLGLTQEEYIILTKEAFVSKNFWDQQSILNGNILIHSPEEYLSRIGVKPVHEYYGYSKEASMLNTDETTQEGLTFVKSQFLKRTGLQYLELVELLRTRCLNPNVPQERALAVMDRIQLSYRFLQSLVNNGAQDPEDKYGPMIAVLVQMTDPQIMAALNGLLGLEDPCQLNKSGDSLEATLLKKWVFNYFERIGKIIVLDNGVKCIDGKLSHNNDNHLVDMGVSIKKCKIVQDSTGKVVGSVDRTTGLVTVSEGQSDVNWSTIVFTGDKGENGIFVRVADKVYLVTTTVETCDLETVRLIHLDGSPLLVEEYERMHRFIRLWRKSGWTIDEMDNALISLGQPGRFEISAPVLHQLAAVKKLYEQTGLELVKLLTFWANINTTGEKSLYKRLFLTHNLASIDSVFHDTNGRYLADPTIKIADHTPVLMAALNLKADDIDAIRRYEGIDQLTIENVSKLYRYRLLSTILGLQATDLISVLPLFGNPFDSADSTLLFLKQWKRMEDAGFTYLQLNYLINGLDDPEKPLAPTRTTVLQLSKTLYDGLNSIAQAHQDLKADPATTDPAEQERERQTLATTDLVKEKAQLLYDQDTVERIIGILEGTNIFSVNGPLGVKDLLRPIPLVAPATVQDYEFFQPDNYPPLRKKVNYDSTKGSLQIKGVLSTAEEDILLRNLIPDASLDNAYNIIKDQQKKAVNETFSSIFTAAQADLLGGVDSNDLPVDPVTNINGNTAPVKRGIFLQVFLPYLRKELSHRLIVATLSVQTGLGTDVTELLLTKILKTGVPATPLYTLLEKINEIISTGQPGWDGYLIPPAQGQYTLIVKDKPVKPVLDLDDVRIDLVERFPREWWSAAQVLQANKVYKLNITGITLEDVNWKTPTSSILPIPSDALLPGDVDDAVTTALTLLQKAALLIDGFSLSADEIQYLSAHPADFDTMDLNKVEFKHFLRLESYTRLRGTLQKPATDLLDFFNWMQRPAAPATDLAKKIEELTGLKKETIEQLILDDHFNLLQPELFRNEIHLLKLQQALKVADKIHANIDLLFDWAKPDSDFTRSRKISESIQQVARAQYQQEDWEQVVKPLNDQLREDQKNALIAYLLVQPALIKWGVTDADGLFEFFLIDVQMDACMETSRIKQAISSVQLFIQRCFLGLEKAHTDILPNQRNEHLDISPDLLDRSRWDWMQRFRIWEANRKVFLYPENWIESNLRDDKSNFFKELESELLQKDINKQNVEDALKSYLYKVDEVANMEVVGVYVEMGAYMENGQRFEKGRKLHVFGRTRNAPYFFYYRYLDLAAGNWYPWEKMQVDIPSYDIEDLRELTNKVTATETLDNGKYVIESVTYQLNQNYKKVIGNGCYLTPIVWNDRLLVFLPQFTRKTKPGEDTAGAKSIVDISEDATDSGKQIEYWEIKMAWSEYRNGKWTQKQLSKDAIADIPYVPGFTKFWRDFNAVTKAKKKIDDAWRDKQYKLKVAWIKRNRWTNSLQNDKQRDWDRYVKAWDAEVDAKDNFDAIMDTSDPDAVINAYKDAYDQFKNDPVPPSAADVARYLFEPVISNAGDLLGIRVDYSKDVNGTNQLEMKGIFEFDGSKVTAAATQQYTYTRNYARIDTFHHYASNIISLQENDFASHLFNDGGATIYTRDPLNDAYTVSFHHSDTQKLLGIINAQQLDAFFRFPVDGAQHNPDKDDVFGGYDHDTNVQTPNSYHELKRPYSIYNWELFFHTPMMLADALSKSQQFEEAMKWYHYVFNPVADGQEANRFWQFTPFKDTDTKNVLESILNKLKPNKADDQINEWRNDPFKPHLVARNRPVAYMKWVVMKYIDNLVAWGDYLFRQDTIESINQATQLYVLAGHILGPRPQVIPKRGKIKPQTYFSLLDKWDANSNAMTELEITLPFSSQTPLFIGVGNGVAGWANVFGFASATYFCIPNNPKLTGYWDTISDRLFKIRHCENIEGIFRKLPLFEPPIDPALLVNAVAQGVSISSVVNDLNTPMPNYRFYYLLQKALDLCGELKSMGAALLSAIEKKDNESISLLRSRHENSVLNLVMEIKKGQLEETQKTLDSLQQNRKAPEHRMRYYLQLIGEDGGKLPGADSDFSEIANAIEIPVSDSGLKLIRYEKEDMDKAHAAADWQIGIGIVETLAAVFHALPSMTVDGKPFGIGAGVNWGFPNLANATTAVGRGLKIYADNLSYQSSSAGKKGGFLRAMQDRVMQANAAGYEIKQIDKQILSQRVRIAIASQEIVNHQKQIENAQEIEEFLKNKYSNEALYSWMKGNLSALYHQVYGMALDLAKKAEKIYRFERGLTSSNFIQAGYWDAGYNGLLAGEQLYAGLKQLEAAHQENRGYDYEITKHVSLRQISPMSIFQLRQTGVCEFTLPEVLFDMDYPGQYKRRIKSVSISVPCIAGPYTGVNGTLRLLENKFRNTASAKNAGEYPEKTDETDTRFQGFIIPVSAIAASSGQNDSGMFELNFKDERYLPFEGAGVISNWRFELPSFRQFDYNTISDLIVHIRYTSVEGGARLKSSAEGSVTNYLKHVADLSKNEGLFSVIDLKHDMPDAWHKLKTSASIDLKITDSRLPYFAGLFTSKRIVHATLIARLNDSAQSTYSVNVPDAVTALVLNKDTNIRLYSGVASGITFNTLFQLSIAQADLSKLEELIILVKYSL